MAHKFSATISISIKAPLEKVWEALTDPKIVKQYFFGVDMKTSWEVGSSIIYSGEWQGQKFEDKGKVLEFKPKEKIVSSYWTAFSGLPESEENYQKITYELASEEKGTKLSITQENVPTEKGAADSKANWEKVLEALKNLLEKQS